MEYMEVLSKISICLMLFAVCVSSFVFLGTISAFNMGQKFMRYFRWLLVTHMIMMLGEVSIWMMNGKPEYAFWMKVCCALSNGGGTMLNTLFACCILGVLEERTTTVSYRPAFWIGVGSAVIFVLSVISVFTGILFDVNEMGFYMDGPWYFIVLCFDWFAIVFEIGIVVWRRNILGKKVAGSMLSFLLLPFTAMLFPYDWYPVPQYLAVTLAMLGLYFAFIEELAKKYAKNEKELVESRIAVTLSQVQPHFLYNTLATISYLCEKDPVLASNMTNNFARYMRTNMDTLRCTSPVPFSEELQHVKTYLQLEKLRFGEELRVEYDIQEENFKIPPLTLQPLAENAVKHGMMGREGIFTIRICSRRCGRFYEIQVIDDGVGFDPNEKKQDGRSHVGISNVRKILELMVNGKLLVKSNPGNGTCVTIQIPVEKEEIQE